MLFLDWEECGSRGSGEEYGNYVKLDDASQVCDNNNAEKDWQQKAEIQNTERGKNMSYGN